jgi:hypothetical protein
VASTGGLSVATSGSLQTGSHWTDTTRLPAVVDLAEIKHLALDHPATTHPPALDKAEKNAGLKSPAS